MTLVETLRADVIKDVASAIAASPDMDPWTDPVAAAAREVNALVSAVEKQTKEGIRKYCDTHPFMRPQDAIAAFVLDPTKESDD
jgi:hypothetical protein